MRKTRQVDGMNKREMGVVKATGGKVGGGTAYKESVPGKDTRQGGR